MTKRIGKVVLVLVLTLVARNARAQSTNTSPASCPSVTVSCPSQNGCDSDTNPTSFLASVRDGSPDLKLSYEWTVNRGRIVSGQGTPQVSVVAVCVPRVVIRDGRWFEEMHPEPFTATVRLIGAPSACVNTVASCSVLAGHHVPPVSLLEEFGHISFSQVRTKLDSFAHALQNNPGSMGYVVSEGNWSFEERAMEYLVNKQKLKAGRVKYVERKKAKEFNVKLYLVPMGAAPPN